MSSSPAALSRSCLLAILTLATALASVAGAAPPGQTPLQLDPGARADLLVHSPSRGLWFNCLFDPDPANAERFTYVGGSWGENWTVLPARLNADGLTDALLYTQSGEWAWKLNSGSGYTDGPTGTWSPGWTLFVADFNGDGLDDVFVYSRASGYWYQCLNEGADQTPPFRYVSGPAWPTDRDIVIGDFNGDGKSDVFSYDPQTGAWTEHLADGATGAGFPITHSNVWSPGWRIVAGALDGDSLTDLFVYNPDNGRWYQCFSTTDGNIFRYYGEGWSSGWQIHPGDFNADGRTDIFVYNPDSGHWYVCLTNLSGDGFKQYLFGSWSPGWEVHVTDFDGDSRADVFVFHPATGFHYQCLNTGDGQFAYHGSSWDPGWLVASRVGDRLDAPPAPPVVVSVSPASGPAGGGTQVTIAGTWFLPGASVAIGGVPALETTRLDSATLLVRTGPHTAGPVDVVVTNPDGLSGALAGAFTYLAPPAPTEPYLPLTDSLSFGDSITEGVTSALTDNLLYSYVTVGYPQRLQALLQARYTGESITVTNAGVGGERAETGIGRLPTVMTPAHNLVILLEGANDLNVSVPPSVVAASLRELIRTARSAGKEVILCTLTPTMPMAVADWAWKGATYAQVVALNALLPAVAASEGVPLADLFAAFGSSYAQYLSPDGLHPNEAGYQRIAETIADVITANFQILR